MDGLISCGSYVNVPYSTIINQFICVIICLLKDYAIVIHVYLIALISQRAANTGWGLEEDRKAKWANDKFENRSMDNKRSRDIPPSYGTERKQPDAYDGRSSRGKNNIETAHKQNGAGSSNLQDTRDRAKPLEYKEDRDSRAFERRSSRYDTESKSRDDYDRREEKRSRTHTQPSLRDSQDERGKDRDRNRDKEKRSTYTRDSSPQHHRDRDDGDHRRARRDEDHHRSRR